ncbi:MAG: hypothetical protein ACFFD4_15590 [Candidatus Odinarchaeota archaeon]
MATEGVIEEASEESPAEQTRFTKIFDIVFIIVLINFAIEVIVTIIAVIFVDGYLKELINLGTVGVVGFVIVIVVSLLGGVAIYEFGIRLRGWEEEKASSWLMYVFFILGGFLTLVVSTILYLVGSVMESVMDPFGLSGISPVLGLLYSLWWLFGLVISTIVLAILALLILASS